MRRRPGDEIGRRSGLKIRGRKACGFKPRPGHQPRGAHSAELTAFPPALQAVLGVAARHHVASAPTGHGPVNATEIAIYAVETRAIIHVLWGLLLIASIGLVGLSITYVLLRIKLRSAEKRERQLARHVATASTDLKRLGERLASVQDLEGEVTSLKAQLHRAHAVRAKMEARAAEQDADCRMTRQAA